MINYSIKYTVGTVAVEQGMFVEAESTEVVPVDTLGASSLGVALHDAAIGAAVGIANDGQVEVQGAVALTPGQYVAADANGRAVVATTGQAILGRVIKGCEASVSGNYDRAIITLTDYQAPSP